MLQGYFRKDETFINLCCGPKTKQCKPTWIPEALEMVAKLMFG